MDPLEIVKKQKELLQQVVNLQGSNRSAAMRQMREAKLLSAVRNTRR